MSDVAFHVLHVCTGNICRSPMAEHLMRSMVGRGWPEQAGRLQVSSAGTWGHTGAPMEPYALSTLGRLGVDGQAFRARELVTELVADADLVLAATREHRAAAVVLHPRAASRSFTLREFARLTDGVDPAALPVGDLVERGRALVLAAAARRGLVPPARPSDDDLADPYRGPESGFGACADLVSASLRHPVALLVAGRDLADGAASGA